jgi:hypothetical protein
MFTKLTQKNHSQCCNSWVHILKSCELQSINALQVVEHIWTNNNVHTIYKLQVARYDSWTSMFIVECLQVAIHLHNSCLDFWTSHCDLWFTSYCALGPMASNLQRLIIFGYKFTSSLLGLQRWWSWTIGWRTFGKSNGCDHSKMEQLNN